MNNLISDDDLNQLIIRLDEALWLLYGTKYKSGNLTVVVIGQVEEILEDVIEDLRLAANPEVQRGIQRLIDEVTGDD